MIADVPSPRNPKEIDRLIDVILDVADALRFAHSRGVLPRDVKPVNVMVGTFGEVMLLDGGIAARFTDDAEAASSVPHVRDLGMIAGTPLYTPPEMAEGRGADSGPWTDVYLLAATLYEVITGKPSRRGSSLFDVLGGATKGVRLVARHVWGEAALDSGDLGVASTAIEGLTDARAEALRGRIVTVDYRFSGTSVTST